MKNLSWIIISLLLHFTIGGALWYSSLSATSPELTEVFDLTLSSATLSENNVSSTRISSLSRKARASSTKISPGAETAEKINFENESDPTEPSTENTEASEATVALGEVTRFPKVSREIKAAYPEEAKRARADGKVILDVVIDRSGIVRDVQLVRGPGFGLNESAIEALKKFEFSPALKGGEPVAVKIRYTYRFKLDVN